MYMHGLQSHRDNACWLFAWKCVMIGTMHVGFSPEQTLSDTHVCVCVSVPRCLLVASTQDAWQVCARASCMPEC